MRNVSLTASLEQYAGQNLPNGTDPSLLNESIPK